MGVYIRTEGTPTSYDIAELMASDPYSMQRPSGNLGKIAINYDFVDSESGTCDIMINGESSYGSIMLSGGPGSIYICYIRLYNGTDARIQLGDEYQSRTIVSHSGTIVLDLDGGTYSFDSIVILDGDEPVPLQSSGALTGDTIGTIRTIRVNESYSTITGTITVTTGGGQKPLLSAHIGEPTYESYIVDLSQSYTGYIPQGDPITKVRLVFSNVTSTVWAQIFIGSGDYNYITPNQYSLYLPGQNTANIPSTGLEGTVTYDFNQITCSWDLTNSSSQSASGSGGISDWALDTISDVPITWNPPSWGDTPTGTIEIRVER